MSNKIIGLGMILALAMLWPFSCVPQTGVPIGGDGCDTIYIESPQLDEQIDGFQKEIARLNKEYQAEQVKSNGLKQQLDDCNNTVATQQALIGTQQTTIAQKEAQIVTLETTITEKDTYITELENRPPETVTDTITVEADYITVQGIEYKVSEIELIRPKREDLTYEMFFCQDSIQNTGKRSFLHEGPTDQYPHFINVASKERGMMKVWFEVPLDSTIKVAKSWILDERRSYETAKTEYVYKSHTKF